MTSGVPTPAPPAPQSRFVGWLLLVLGALMVVLCGGCTLTLWGVGIAGLRQDHSGAAWGAMVGLLVTTLLIGGLPTAAGAVLVWAGWRALRPARTPRTVAKDFE